MRLLQAPYQSPCVHIHWHNAPSDLDLYTVTSWLEKTINKFPVGSLVPYLPWIQGSATPIRIPSLRRCPEISRSDPRAAYER